MLHKKIQYRDYSIFIYKESHRYRLIFQDMEVVCDTYEQVLESGYTLVLIALKEAEKKSDKFERSDEKLEMIKKVLQ